LEFGNWPFAEGFANLVGGQVVTLIYVSKYLKHHLAVKILLLAQVIDTLASSELSFW